MVLSDWLSARVRWADAPPMVIVYIALFFGSTAIGLPSGTSPNSQIGRFGAVNSSNSLIRPCDVRLLARKFLSFEGR